MGNRNATTVIFISVCIFSLHRFVSLHRLRLSSLYNLNFSPWRFIIWASILQRRRFFYFLLMKSQVRRWRFFYFLLMKSQVHRFFYFLLMKSQVHRWPEIHEWVLCVFWLFCLLFCRSVISFKDFAGGWTCRSVTSFKDFAGGWTAFRILTNLVLYCRFGKWKIDTCRSPDDGKDNHHGYIYFLPRDICLHFFNKCKRTDSFFRWAWKS